MKHIAFAAFLGVMLQVTAAFAQGQGGGSPVYQNWFPVGTPATLNVSNVTANVALPTGGLTARVCNTGATDAYVVLGTANTVVATTTAGSFLASGKCQPFNLLPFATRYTYIAAITASSTTTIRVESGLGSPIASDAAGASAHPSGPAGGDLSGTYPNPTVAKASGAFTINGCTIGSNAVCAAGTGQMTGLGINGAPVTTSLISIYNSTPAERIELGINGSAVGLGLGSGGATLWGSSATPGSYDTGLFRDSVLGAGNLDLGNATANDKSGTLNLGIANIGANGAASVAPLLMNGTILTSGTGTTNFPALFIQPTGTTAATTWNTAGTGIGLNLAGAFTGNFIDLHLGGGGSIFKVDSFGAATSTSKMQGQYFIRTGSVSGPAWTTVGAGISSFANTFTDTSSSGTVAAQYINAFKAPTVAASSGTVYTNSYNTYFENPVAGANVTQTNAWALGADSFKVANGSTFGGALTLGGNSIVGVGALVAGGSAPTGSGTCTRGAQTGGNTTGTIVLTCTAQTLILTFTTTAATGWMCEAIDQTTTADTMKQTSNTTTSCTLTGTTAASDVILFQARAY